MLNHYDILFIMVLKINHFNVRSFFSLNMASFHFPIHFLLPEKEQLLKSENKRTALELN